MFYRLSLSSSDAFAQGAHILYVPQAWAYTLDWHCSIGLICAAAVKYKRAICVQVYGSGGHLYWPYASKVTGAASTLKTYTRCTAADEGVNLHVKTFAQPRHTIAAANPHYFTYKEGYFAVSPDQTQVVHLGRNPWPPHALLIKWLFHSVKTDV